MLGDVSGGSGVAGETANGVVPGRVAAARDRRRQWLLALAGVAAVVVAASLDSSAARSAASQVWPPFVLVSGLLLIGLVADDDGLFAAAGQLLSRSARRNIVLFVGATALVAVTTAVLNLDTSVAFLTPVLVYASRHRRGMEAALVYGCLLVSNAGSLLLPGSNLTNLIVLGHLHLSGGQFVGRMWLPSLVAVIATAAVVGVVERRSLLVRDGAATGPTRVERPVLGVGAVAVVAAAVLIVALRAPALPVVVVGVVAAGIELARGRQTAQRMWSVLGLPLLVGLFGMAVALGTVGRTWSGPSMLLAHLNGWTTALAAAGAAVLVNNLPAASLLSARTPPHPFSLLVGLNLGPNLFVTGSLAWILWLRSARTAGAQPSITRAARVGLVAVPLSMAGALAALAVTAYR